MAEPNDDDGRVLPPQEDFKEFEPLRKRAKVSDDSYLEVENNYMPSYYNPAPEVLRRTQEEIRDIRIRNEITVNGDSIPAPVTSWAEAGLPSELQWKLWYSGYYEPTPIQKQAIPAALTGRDILATADTGSGKTLAYLIPMVTFLNTQPPTMQGQGPMAIILAPTRELVQQIYNEAHRLLSPWHVFQTQLMLNNPHGTGSIRLGMLSLQQQQQMDNSTAVAPLTTDQEVAADTQQAWENYYYQLQLQQQQQQQQSMQYATMGANAGVVGIQRKVLGVVGGLSINGQIATLRAGVDVLVATPGRLLDLLARHAFSLDRLKYLVFDEIDRMLEQRMRPDAATAAAEDGPAAAAEASQSNSKQALGSMEDQLRRFVAQCSFNERQTLLFSATMPQSVVRLARSAVLDPIIIKIGSSSRSALATGSKSSLSPSERASQDGAGNSAIPANIKQHVIFVQSAMKNQKLLDVIRKTIAPPIIIFCDHINTVDKVVDLLRSEQFHVAGMHSEKSQEYRFKVIETMRRGRLDVLVATDIASRGLDFPDITHVIQYDLPETIEDYIHRVGRTGRAGREGHATALLTYSCKIAGPLRQVLRQSGAQVPKELETHVHMFGRKVVQTEFGDKVIYD